MFKLMITVAALVATVTTSAGEVDGVNVSCEAKSRGETLLWTDYLFLSFSDGKVTRRDLGATSNAAEVEEEVYNYRTTDRSVFWEVKPYFSYGDVQRYSLHRAKLTIDITSTPKDGCYTGGTERQWDALQGALPPQTFAARAKKLTPAGSWMLSQRRRN